MLFWSIPPGDSPSRISGNRWLCRNAWQNSQERLAVSACTVLDRGFDRNRKAARVCAETVDDRNFLWKHAEKLDEIKIVFSNANDVVDRAHSHTCRNALASVNTKKSLGPCMLTLGSS